MGFHYNLPGPSCRSVRIWRSAEEISNRGRHPAHVGPARDSGDCRRSRGGQRRRRPAAVRLHRRRAVPRRDARDVGRRGHCLAEDRRPRAVSRRVGRGCGRGNTRAHAARRAVPRTTEVLVDSGRRAAIGVVFGVIFLRTEYAGDMSTWQFVPGSSGQVRSAAGWWYLLVSLPVFQLLILFWALRYVLWCWFLFRLSRLDLVLIPSHPDRSGGPETHRTGASVLGSSWSSRSRRSSRSSIGLELVDEADRSSTTGCELAAFLGLSLVVLFVPFLAFSGKLLDARHRGLLDYGLLAAGYTRAFDEKWVRTRRRGGRGGPGRRAGRRAAPGERRHPVARRPGQQLRRLSTGLRFVPFETLNVVHHRAGGRDPVRSARRSRWSRRSTSPRQVIQILSVSVRHDRPSRGPRADRRRHGARAHDSGRRSDADGLDQNRAVDDQLRLHDLQVPPGHVRVGKVRARVGAGWAAQFRPRAHLPRRVGARDRLPAGTGARCGGSIPGARRSP